MFLTSSDSRFVHFDDCPPDHFEQRLMEVGRNGAFLIRTCRTLENALTLLVLHNGGVSKYRFLVTADYVFYVECKNGVENVRHPSLVSLIDSLRSENNGIICPLTEAVLPMLTGEQIDESDSDSDLDDNTRTLVSSIMKKRFENLDLHLFSAETKKRLLRYIENGVLVDYSTAMSGDNQLLYLHELLDECTRGLQKEYQNFLRTISMIKQLHLVKTEKEISDENLSFSTMLQSMKNAQFLVEETEKLALDSLLSIGNTMHSSNSFPTISSSLRPHSDELHQFEVTECGRKATLSVDRNTRRLCITRTSPNQRPLEFTLAEIKLPLNKSRDSAFLKFNFLNKDKCEIEFKDKSDRNAFCCLVEKLISHADLDQLSIFVGTWNMNNSLSKADLSSWLLCQGQGIVRHQQLSIADDLYVIGTQENKWSDKTWTNFLETELFRVFQVPFTLVHSVSLWSIKLSIFVKTEYAEFVSNCEHSTVKTGLRNALGNKGGVGVSFIFKGTSFCFINCHLAARSENLQRRKQNIRDILNKLQLKGCNDFSLVNRFHYLFFFGDLNFRVHDITPMDSLELIKNGFCSNGGMNTLLTHDQLSSIKHSHLATFNEQTITFQPTYRYQCNSRDVYEWKKIKKSEVRVNIPSWCDRVLYCHHPSLHLENTSYGCTNDIVLGDHSPVFSSFNIAVQQLVDASSDEQKVIVDIVITEVEASFKDLTANVSKQFTLYVYSTFHNEIVSYAPAVLNSSGKSSVLVWRPPNKTLMFSRRECGAHFIRDHHLIFSIKSDSELIGESIVSFVKVLEERPESLTLSLNGLLLGTLTFEVSNRCSLQLEQRYTQEELELSLRRTRLRSYEMVIEEGAFNKVTNWLLTLPSEVSNDTPPSIPSVRSTQSSNVFLPTSGEDSLSIPKENERNSHLVEGYSRIVIPQRQQPLYQNLYSGEVTIKEVLSDFGLLQYLSCFTSKGYHCLHQLHTIKSREEFAQFAVDIPEHRDRLWEVVKNMIL